MDKTGIVELIAAAVNYKKEAEVDLSLVDITLVAGRTLLRNQARHNYDAAFLALTQVIGLHAGAIFVTGEGAAKFADIAKEKAPAIVLDAAELYRRIAEKWYPTVRVDQVFALDSVISMWDGTMQCLPSVGVREIAKPEFGRFFGRPVHTLEDAIEVTRDILRSTVGDELNGLYLNRRLADEAVREEWDLKRIPVVVVGASREELTAPQGLLNGLFYGHNIVVATKETVEDSEVAEACKALRTKMNETK